MVSKRTEIWTADEQQEVTGYIGGVECEITVVCGGREVGLVEVDGLPAGDNFVPFIRLGDGTVVCEDCDYFLLENYGTSEVQ